MTKLWFSIFFLCLYVTPLFSEKPALYKTVYHTEEQSLDIFFPDANMVISKNVILTTPLKERIEKRLGWVLPKTSLVYWEGYKDHNSQGYALSLDEMGKHYPMTFMVYMSPQFKVKKIVFMVYRERIGADVRKNRFLKQFKNKTSLDRLTVDDDVDGISGATISSWAVASGVKRALIMMEEIIKQENKRIHAKKKKS